MAFEAYTHLFQLKKYNNITNWFVPSWKENISQYKHNA